MSVTRHIPRNPIETDFTQNSGPKGVVKISDEPLFRRQIPNECCQELG